LEEIMGFWDTVRALIFGENEGISPCTFPLPPETVCPVHGVDLRVGKVWIEYGLYCFSDDFVEAQSARFPWANSRVMGGCIIRHGVPGRVDVKYCPECRESEKAY